MGRIAEPKARMEPVPPQDVVRPPDHVAKPTKMSFDIELGRRDIQVADLGMTRGEVCIERGRWKIRAGTPMETFECTNRQQQSAQKRRWNGAAREVRRTFDSTRAYRMSRRMACPVRRLPITA